MMTMNRAMNDVNDVAAVLSVMTDLSLTSSWLIRDLFPFCRRRRRRRWVSLTAGHVTRPTSYAISMLINTSPY